jgi:hypothetical protein
MIRSVHPRIPAVFASHHVHVNKVPGVAKADENPKMRNVSVSQNDNDKYCRCENCASIDAREESPMGSVLAFVNAVADEVAKNHPGVKVGTLAYRYSRKPPKTLRARPNVQIQLCSLEACAFHPIGDASCPGNASFAADLEAWSRITDQIWIWNYFADYLLPVANLRMIGPNIRYFVSRNAKGAIMQAAYDGDGAEMCELRNYLLANLLWDTSKDAEWLTDEFLQLHYGRGAPPIRRYLTFLHDRTAASGKHPTFAGNADPFAIDAEIAAAGVAAFEEAMTLAEVDPTRARIERASVGAYWAALEPVWRVRDKSALSAEQAEKMKPLAEKFVRICRERNVTYAGENVPLDRDLQRLTRLFDLATAP